MLLPPLLRLRRCAPVLCCICMPVRRAVPSEKESSTSTATAHGAQRSSHAAMPCHRPSPCGFFNPALMIRCSPACSLLPGHSRALVKPPSPRVKTKPGSSQLAPSLAWLSSPAPTPLPRSPQLLLHNARNSICRRYKPSLPSLYSGRLLLLLLAGVELFLGAGMELGLSLGDAAVPDAGRAAPELGLGLGVGIGSNAAGTGRGSKAAGTTGATGWWAAPATPESAVRLSLVSSLGLQWPPPDGGESRVLSCSFGCSAL